MTGDGTSGDPNGEDVRTDWNRRTVLAVTGTTLTGTLAGCSGGDGDGGDGSDETTTAGEQSDGDDGTDDTATPDDGTDDTATPDDGNGQTETTTEGDTTTEADDDDSDDDSDDEAAEIDPSYDGWSRYLVDAGASAYAPDASLPGESATVEWQDGENATYATGRPPIVVEGLVYAGGDGGLVAYNAVDGSQVWSADVDGFGRSRSPPATVVDGTVFVADDDEEDVVALDAETGEERWRYADLSYYADVLRVADGRVFAAEARRTTDNSLQAIDASDGSGLWNHEPEEFGTITANAVLAGDAVLFGGVLPSEGDGYVGVLDAASGDLRYQFVTNTEPIHLAARGDSFYALTRPEGDQSTMVYAGSVESGDQQWVYELVDPSGHHAVDDDNVYVARESGSVVALDRGTGDVAWTQDGVDSPRVEFVTDDAVVVAGAGEVAGLDPGSGSVTTSIDVPDDSPRELTVANGRLFFAGDGYEVYAVDG